MIRPTSLAVISLLSLHCILVQVPQASVPMFAYFAQEYGQTHLMISNTMNKRRDRVEILHAKPIINCTSHDGCRSNHYSTAYYHRLSHHYSSAYYSRLNDHCSPYNHRPNHSPGNHHKRRYNHCYYNNYRKDNNNNNNQADNHNSASFIFRACSLRHYPHSFLLSHWFHSPCGRLFLHM